ncbi:HmuY family protein [Bacteroides thetaiotaomicron]|nr:HmuY family protein [Bacteroides thetaiotaomicron]
MPAEWDLAFHRYVIKTNEGAAFHTTYTSIDDLKSSGKLPAEENFVKD